MEEKREAYDIRKISSWYWKNGGGVRIILNSERNPWWYVAYKKLREILGIPVFAMMPRKEIMDDIAKEIPKFVGVRFRIWGGEGWGGPGPTLKCPSSSTGTTQKYWRICPKRWSDG